jgi:Flp pilus assembly protein TadG
MGWINKLRSRDEGANLVEFAVIAPLLFLLLFGVIEFARLAYGYSTVWNAAREGARYATTVGNTDGTGPPNYLDCVAIADAAVAKVAGVDLDSTDITVTYSDSSGNEVADCAVSPPAPLGVANIDSGFTIQVEASSTFDAIVPLLSPFLDGTELSSTQTRSIFKGVIGEG